MSYEDAVKNKDLKSFLRSAPSSDEEFVEGVIMDSGGVTTDDIKRIAAREGRSLRKDDVERHVFNINRKHALELGVHRIVSKNGLWIWRFE